MHTWFLFNQAVSLASFEVSLVSMRMLWRLRFMCF